MAKRVGGSHNLQFGTSTITFELLYSERKTLAVHVYPDLSVVVDAPLTASFDDIMEAVQHRAAWILKQQRDLERYPSAALPPRRYVSGEAYRYLGRQYRLKVHEDQIERIVLARGYLTVGLPNPVDKSHIQELLEAWYLRQAQRVFLEQLAVCYPRVAHLQVAYPQLIIRAMKSRWGSCSPTGRLTLNLKLIQVPKPLIDYVILHELCHLKELNHTAAFYRLLDRILPGWERLKNTLNEYEFT